MQRFTRRARKSPRHARHGQTRPLSLEALDARRLLAVVSGHVIFDANANGMVDLGESGAADVSLLLKDTAGSVVNGPATTDSTGAYSFNDVADGDYRVAIDFAVGSDLVQSFPGPLTSPDRLGAVRDAFDSPLSPLVDDPTPVGLAWVGSDLYTTNRAAADASNTDKAIFSWDGTAWQEKFTAAGTESVYDLAYDGTDLWVADYTGNQIVRYDSDGNSLASYTANTVDSTARLRGITWDGSHFWVIEQKNNSDGTALEHRLQKWSLDPSGSATVLESIDLPFEAPIGLEHHQGTFWLTSSSTDSIYAIDIAASSGGSAVIVEQFVAPAENDNLPTGVAIKDDSLFVAQYFDNRVFELDLGSPQTQAITVAGSDVTVADFGVSAYGQVAGVVYEDFDQDGVQDSGETGLEGWQVYHDENGNGQFETFEQTVLTEGNGSYLIDRVLPGTNAIRLNTRTPGWANTTADSSSETILAETISIADFGLFQSGFGPVGPEIQVTTRQVDHNSRSPEVAINSNGYSAVVYEVSGESTLYAQFFDSTGAAVSAEVNIDAATAGDQFLPVVSEIRNGEAFVVGWTSGSDPDRQAYIQVFSQTGVPQTEPIAVGSKRAESVIFEVDANSSGEIAVSYNEITDASGPGNWKDSVISVERFSATGASLGRATNLLDPPLIGAFGSVALDDDGGFTVAWPHDNQVIFAQRFDASGKSLGNYFQVNEANGKNATRPQIATDGNGNHVVSWVEWVGEEPAVGKLSRLTTGSTTGVLSDFTVSNGNVRPRIDLRTDGVLAVTEYGADGISAQRFSPDSSGTMQPLDSTSYIVNTTPDGTFPDAALGPDGDMTVVWNGTESANQGVYLQRFAEPTTPVANVAVSQLNTASSVVQGDQASVDVVLDNLGTTNESAVDVTLVSDNGTADTADDISIAIWNGVTLDAGDSQVLTTSWNTTGANTTDHTLTATATPVANETDTADNALSATVTVEAAPTGSISDIYVSEISFDERSRGKRHTDYQVVVKIRQDSDADGFGEQNGDDDVLAGVTVTVKFNGDTYTGTTDANGEFRTEWIKNVGSGNHYANVVDLAVTGYNWDPLALDLEDDSDEDGLPDAEWSI